MLSCGKLLRNIHNRTKDCVQYDLLMFFMSFMNTKAAFIWKNKNIYLKK